VATEIYFARHGESMDNVAGITFDEMDVDEEGFLDNPLSELGVKQAESLADWIESHKTRPGAIFSSGLARSTLTAKPTSERLGLEIIEMPDLREVHVQRDTLSGLKVENTMSRSLYEIPGGKALRNKFMEIGVFAAFNLWSKFGLPGFESPEDLKSRAGACLDSLAARPERVVLAVAHNFFLGALLLELIDRNPLNYIKAAPRLGFMPNCSVTCVIAHPPKFRIRYIAAETNNYECE
jgi:broad specificity phosphatase PhoE